MNQRILLIILFSTAALAGLISSWIWHRQPAEPIYIEPQRTFHYPAAFVASLKGDPQAGKKIFNEFCSACHGEQPIIPIVAPHIHHPQEWKPYQHLGINVLLPIVSSGNGAMPARGGCFECSDEQLKEAIRYLLNNEKP